MAFSSSQILLTGATGYIGGTILAHLLAHYESNVTNTIITCLVRGADRASTLSSTYGTRVRPIVYQGHDDLETTAIIAAQHDIVIHAAISYHAGSAQALLRGLAQRKAETGREVWMIHTSGTSNLSDQPISGKWTEEWELEFDDVKDDIYGYEKQREASGAYAQRTVELSVVDTGLKLGVNVLVIMPPLIYGRGTGLFNQISVQIPVYIRAALKRGRAVVVGEGKGELDHVHVEDLAELYALVVKYILAGRGDELLNSTKGIIFAENGRHSWMEVAQAVADVCYEQDKITDKSVEKVKLADGAKILAVMGHSDEDTVERSVCSSSRTVASAARGLGWKPIKHDNTWREGFKEDLEAVLNEKV